MRYEVDFMHAAIHSQGNKQIYFFQASIGAIQLIQFFQVDVIYHSQASQKYFEIMNYEYCWKEVRVFFFFFFFFPIQLFTLQQFLRFSQPSEYFSGKQLFEGQGENSFISRMMVFQIILQIMLKARNFQSMKFLQHLISGFFEAVFGFCSVLFLQFSLNIIICGILMLWFDQFTIIRNSLIQQQC